MDLLEVRRMRDLLREYPERARDRLFTDAERVHCEKRRDPTECYAARYAAKEACLKALGTGIGRGVGWRDIELLTDDLGRPQIDLSGRALERMRRMGGGRVHVTLTHDAGVAVAVVMIEE